MQEEINSQTVAIAVSTTKMTAHALARAIEIYLSSMKNDPKIYRGKQTLRRLTEQNATLSSIEVTNENIKAFEKAARKYHIDYALKKDRSSNKFVVFFKGKDIDVITMAFKEYSKGRLEKKEKPSVRSDLEKLLKNKKHFSNEKEKIIER